MFKSSVFTSMSDMNGLNLCIMPNRIIICSELFGRNIFNTLRNMQATIKTIKTKNFVGMRETMSILENTTFNLFHSFMPRRKEIINTLNNNILDLKVYPENYFLNFNPSTLFTKWALVEVSDFKNIPKGMESFILESGKYAVFNSKTGDDSIFNYIFTTWLHKSKYGLDNRPHFDVLSENTKINNPNSEQKIWIPIR